MVDFIKKTSQSVAFAACCLVALTQNVWPQQAGWPDVVEKAKKEGQVLIYAGPGQEAFFREFQKKYPEINVVYISGHGGERVQRIMAERRAGKYLADLYMGGAGPMIDLHYKAKIFDPVKSALILPEVVDLSKWWKGKHLYLDKQGEYILGFKGTPQNYFHFNTTLVKPAQITSYWDFLNPQWKGQMVVVEPMSAGTDSALRFLYHKPELGPRFLERFLQEMNLTATRDTRQFVDWLATGKFALAGLQAPDRADIYGAKKRGLPVTWFDTQRFREGGVISTSDGNLGLLNRAPHPNAATVFINWLLSREGQVGYQRISADSDSLRIDIPKEDVPPHARRLDGAAYALLTDSPYIELDPVRNFVNEFWKKR